MSQTAVEQHANGLIRRAGEVSLADRAYLFKFSAGNRMHNTHEWVSTGTEQFKDKLCNLPCDALPVFVNYIKSQKQVVVANRTFPEAAPLEEQEMERENIHSLVLAPVVVGGSVFGFVGLDSCRPGRVWNGYDVSFLCDVARDIGALYHTFATPKGNVPMLTFPRAVVRAPRTLQVEEHPQRQFALKGYARIPPTMWRDEGISQFALDDFVARCQMRWKDLLPDIPPYTRFRDVGYARYRYYKGSFRALQHKDFFQVDPEANVLLASKPRPFNRIPDEIREHPVLMDILRILLETVWMGDLGDDVHVNVHPVRVRNFHEGEIHSEHHATLEGTHIDSTQRVAVMMIERHNVKSGQARTCLYDAKCPIGLRRDVPEDEEILKKHRLFEHMLAEPLETLTFNDTLFKHDASDFDPATEGQECYRNIMLIMCRRPFEGESPIDGRVIDGFTPRSPRSPGSAPTPCRNTDPTV